MSEEKLEYYENEDDELLLFKLFEDEDKMNKILREIKYILGEKEEIILSITDVGMPTFFLTYIEPVNSTTEETIEKITESMDTSDIMYTEFISVNRENFNSIIREYIQFKADSLVNELSDFLEEMGDLLPDENLDLNGLFDDEDNN